MVVDEISPDTDYDLATIFLLAQVADKCTYEAISDVGRGIELKDVNIAATCVPVQSSAATLATQLAKVMKC